MPYMPRHTLRLSHAWHAYCTSRAWNGPSLARVDSPACLTVTYDLIEETHRMQGQPTNEYSLLEGLVEYILHLRQCYICIYCSEIDQHQYHVSASYIRIVLHAIFQLCTPTSTAQFRMTRSPKLCCNHLFILYYIIDIYELMIIEQYI